ncbi:CGNR zinc finger domain-containing protein [Pseudonocardia kujensis]|uniref:CGNR zinc finger domain-containing protein n=1 Tax=Pseudonocardia kujensis TaxID=1128675 RepID=UPI001E395BA4|nr:CGNR zinc finger domain-containing protein [Pseudonocardia kujensis]MCE0764459.1 CGNR zinc finger domain-containing protein [Pseudonocardia kujensis]
MSDYPRGAELAGALVATAPRVWHGVEKLGTPGEVDALLAEHGFAGSCTPAELDGVRDLRTELRAIVDAAVAGEETGVVVRRASALAAGGLTLGEAGPARGGLPAWVFGSDAGLVEGLAAVTGVGLLGAVRALGPERFRACAAPFCEGAFVDVSRAGRRRYCMPDLCGNRVHVANHRARRRSG